MYGQGPKMIRATLTARRAAREASCCRLTGRQAFPRLGLPYLQRRAAAHHRYTPEPQKHNVFDWVAHPDVLHHFVNTWFLQYQKTHDRKLSTLHTHAISHFATDFLSFHGDFIKDRSSRALISSADLTKFKAILKYNEDHGMTLYHARALLQILPTLADGGYRNLARDLSRFLSASGDARSTAIYLSQALRQHQRGGRGALTDPATQAIREDLRKRINEGNDAFWELSVLDAKLLLAEKKLSAAEARLKQSLPAAIKASRDDTRSPLFAKELFGNEDPKLHRADMYGLMTPWEDLLSVHFSKRATAAPEAQGKLAQEIADLIDVGIEGDGALAHWYAAERAMGEHLQKEQQGHFDEDAQLTREPRLFENIGKSSAWLYHITKAAASGLPDACTELGKFYYTTAWRYLDDEPPATAKPTPLDRYPEETPIGVYWHRLLRSIGLEVSVASPQDMFTTVTEPASLELRLDLATRWLRLAVSLGHAPALRPLIEIYSNEEISGNILPTDDAVRLQPSRYSYSSKVDLYNAIFEGRYDKPSTPHLVPNPKCSDADARTYIAHAMYALEARRLYQQFLKKNTRTKPAAIDNDMVQYFIKGIQTTYNHDSIRAWVTYQDTFQLWQDDDEFCQDLSTYIRTLCDERQWDIFDEHNMQRYRHKRSQTQG